MNMTREELVEKIKNASPNDDKAFQEIIAAFTDMLSLDDIELAEMFGISRPTATRWRTGTNSPHPAVRPPMFQKLIQELQKAT